MATTPAGKHRAPAHKSSSNCVSKPQQPSKTPTGLPKNRHSKASRRRKSHAKILGSLDANSYLAASKSRLLSLPAELRLLIWEYSLTSTTGQLHYNPTTSRFDVSSIGAALITTCHLVALETLYLPLRLNILVFDYGHTNTGGCWDFLTFLRRMNDVEAKNESLLKIKVAQVGQPAVDVSTALIYRADVDGERE